MKSRVGVLAVAILVGILASVAGARAEPAPEFRLGFKALADRIPDIAGQPLENEHYDINGDSLQRTTTGLMVWRKADNWTAFTDGARTWVNGPNGVQDRPKDSRFPWEHDDLARETSPVPGGGQTSFPASVASPADGYPKVNVHPSSSPAVDWSVAPIFWFGRATEHDNYVDVRVAYDSQNLYLNAAIVDYCLWFDPAGASDPRWYDAIALYLSASGGAIASPIDYLFVSGYRNTWPPGNDPRWHRQARRAESGWDYHWLPAAGWSDSVGARWYDSGPNNNADRDAGWATTLTIPWANLGMSGPPPSGSTMRMALKLYDRDDPGVDTVPTECWPPSMDEDAHDTWGVLALDPPAYRAAATTATGKTVIRRGFNGAVVKDSYAGGGGLCAGGIFGDGDKPHPTDEHLFVQNQSDIADFPCFSKSYLSFDLSAIPAGKRIVSARLRIYQFGGSDPSQAKPSLVQLLTIADDWDETTLTWNKAPMARENVSAAIVPVIRDFPGWPGVPIEWDATQAVVEAYATGKAANVALYSADTAYHSGKYFVSSDTGDWNADGRPTLTVVWGD